MKQRKVFALLGLLLMVGMTVFAGGGRQAATTADGSRIFTFASDATWPPMEFVDETSGEVIGFSIDLINAIGDAAGFVPEIKNTAWDGIFAGLANNQYDAVISSVTITDERKLQYDFSNPYVNAGQVIVVRNSTNNISGPADLAGKKAGAQQGTTGAFAISDIAGASLQNYDEIGLAIAALARGDLDAVVADGPIAADFALQNENYANTLKIVGDPFTEEFYGVVVRKGNSEVLDLVNQGLATITANGTLEQIKAKWLY
ncbi:MAG: basic amino acid ABC transporter substrate-binding protein [Spirochaetales bacterium]|nr:basic amino acid ABC transporter substrate-binding protein [Spirochaetales bacterium]